MGVLRQVACGLRKAPVLVRDGDPTSSLSTVNCASERAISLEGGKLLLPATWFCRACCTEEGEEEQLHTAGLTSFPSSCPSHGYTVGQAAHYLEDSLPAKPKQPCSEPTQVRQATALSLRSPARSWDLPPRRDAGPIQISPVPLYHHYVPCFLLLVNKVLAAPPSLPPQGLECLF